MSASEYTIVMVVSNDASSDPRVNKEATALTSAGYAVTVLAWDRGGFAAEREVRDGATYARLGPRAPYGGGMRSLPRYREFWRRAVDAMREIGPDAVHCHDLDTAWAGYTYAREVSECRLVVDHHELYKHSPMVPRTGLLGALSRAVLGTLDRVTGRAASLVVVANPGNAPYFSGIAPGKTVVVENAADASVFRPAGREASEPFTVCFIGRKRYPESLRRLISVVSRHDRMAAIVAGDGTAKEEVARMAEGVPNVKATGAVPYEDIPRMYESCDAVYALYDARVGNIRTSFPVKAMEGMACGLPVLVDDGTWVGEYVESHGIGLAVDSSDEAAVEAALLRLASDRVAASEMGERGRRLVEAGLNWEESAARLVAAYDDLLRAEPGETEGRA
jgi:glycosyltransferase involved in cell wall biosynthesis